MTDVEKRVLMQYAAALLRGERVFPDNADPKLPDGWIDNVKKMLAAEEGAPGAVANQYSPSFSASYAKLLHFWTNPHHERFDNLERIEDMRNQVDDDFVPMPVVFESMKQSNRRSRTFVLSRQSPLWTQLRARPTTPTFLTMSI